VIITSDLKLVWPAFGFTIEVGRNEITKLPEAGKEQIKRRLMQLAKAGLVTIEKPETKGGDRDVQDPVPRVQVGE
jgi:hypothetical protein